MVAMAWYLKGIASFATVGVIVFLAFVIGQAWNCRERRQQKPTS